VDQALRLLEELRSGGPGNVADLGRRIGVSRSAAGRLLTSLETHQFTRRTEDGFDLGYGLLRFSEELGAGLRTAASLELRRLAEHFDETAALAVRDGTHAVAIAQVVPSDRVVSIQYRPGTRHALSVGAHGLAMLADVTLPLDQVDETLVPRLAEAARIGYAVSRDELEPGVTGIAAPIAAGAAPPMAAIGIVAPSVRFPDITSVALAVMNAADRISRELSGDPHPAPAST
jgi:DNA-binding IclR family transcriptional regulator